MARATTKQQVLDGISKLTLQTNKHGQYTHDAILLIQKGIQRVLVSQFNPSDPGKGMVKLLNNVDNILMQVQSTNAITAGSILKLAKKRADFNNNRQNHPLYLHHTNGGTGGSQPIKCHQSISHRCKGGRCQGSIKTGWQQHNRCHSMNGRWQQPQKHQQLHALQCDEGCNQQG